MRTSRSRATVGQLVWALALGGVALGACKDGVSEMDTLGASAPVGDLSLALDPSPAVAFGEISYRVTGPDDFERSGRVDGGVLGAPLEVAVEDLPAAQDYVLALSAESADGRFVCSGSAMFDIRADETTTLSLPLSCEASSKTGDLDALAVPTGCPAIATLGVAPVRATVGERIALSVVAVDVVAGPADLRYTWTTAAGTIANPVAAETSVTCQQPGRFDLGVEVSDGECTDARQTAITCDPVPSGGACSADADCLDADLCNGTERCANGVCQPGAALSCATDNVCATAVCVPERGCDEAPVADATPCALGACVGGTCVAECASLAQCARGGCADAACGVLEGTVTGTCSAVAPAPCGGELVGTWRFEDSCIEAGDAVLQSQVPREAVVPEGCGDVSVSLGYDVRGTLSFAADGSYSADLSRTVDSVVSLPSACMLGGGCPAGYTERGARCELANGADSASAAEGTWSAVGTEMTTQAATAAATSAWYCVDGDVLTVQTPIGAGAVLTQRLSRVAP